MLIEHSSTPLPTASGEEQGIDLLAIVAAIVTEWRIILATMIPVLLLCAFLIYSMKSHFISSASILPTNSRGQDNGLAELFGARSPGALYVGLLGSRSVQDDVIDATGFLAAMHIKDRAAARGMLAGETTFTEGADSLITIKVKDANAQRSAQLANAYLDGLRDLNDRLSLNQSAETRKFFEIQLQQERELLSIAEDKLAHTQKGTGLVDPSVQMQMGIGGIQSVRTQITGYQVQLAGLLQRETENAPEVQALRSQIRQLEAEEHQMESGTASPVEAAPSAAGLPAKILDMQRAERDVKQHELIVESVASQFEKARLAEAEKNSSFEVIDRAIVPDHKTYPPRMLLLLLAAVISLVLGLMAAVIKRVWLRISADPVSQVHLTGLRNAFRRK
ncbi:MAG: GNVR domain-containing protein [Acidobacteriaceae bacterium]|nr:GNVR domain-containing protein [Acidobacteriaceae bacterium]